MLIKSRFDGKGQLHFVSFKTYETIKWTILVLKRQKWYEWNHNSLNLRKDLRLYVYQIEIEWNEFIKKSFKFSLKALFDLI